MRRFTTLIALSLVLTVVPACFVHATDTPPKAKGLQITPLRQYTTVDAGSTKDSSFTVINLTDRPMTINFSVRKFSVSNYSYTYRFAVPTDNTVILGIKQVTLAPGKSQKVVYTVAPNANAKPGGRYYTLLASAEASSGGVKSTIQAGSLLYLTINGRLIQTGNLQSSSIRRLNFGNDIPYTLNIANTGNVHYFVYPSGSLRGWLTQPATPLTGNILLPGSVRRVTGAIPSPVLPGIYRATYGYKSDTGQRFTTSSNIVFVPPWFIAFILATVTVGFAYKASKRAAKQDATR